MPGDTRYSCFCSGLIRLPSSSIAFSYSYRWFVFSTALPHSICTIHSNDIFSCQPSASVFWSVKLCQRAHFIHTDSVWSELLDSCIPVMSVWVCAFYSVLSAGCTLEVGFVLVYCWCLSQNASHNIFLINSEASSSIKLPIWLSCVSCNFVSISSSDSAVTASLH